MLARHLLPIHTVLKRPRKGYVYGHVVQFMSIAWYEGTDSKLWFAQVVLYEQQSPDVISGMDVVDATKSCPLVTYPLNTSMLQSCSDVWLLGLVLVSSTCPIPT